MRVPVDIKENRISEVKDRFNAGVENTMRRGTEITRLDMVQGCPVGPEENKPPGQPHMVETIEKTPESLEGDPRDGKMQTEVKVGDPAAGVDYTGYVVLGTSKQAAQDFVSPAYEAGRRHITSGLQAVIR